MTKEAFHQIVQKINPILWEQSTPIGKFKNLTITNTIIRPYSYVVRCEIKGSIGEDVAFVKLYRNPKVKDLSEIAGLIQRDYDTFAFWTEKFTDLPNFNVVEPLWVLPEEHLLATREARGQTLFDLMLKNAAYFPGKAKTSLMEQHFEDVGTWLQHYQKLGGTGDELFDVGQLVEYVVERLNRLTSSRETLFPMTYCHKIEAFMERVRNQIPEEQLRTCRTHNDFNLSNIMVDGDRVSVLDFGASKVDSIYLDLSRFYHQLYLWSFKPNYRIRNIDKFQKSFLRGFGITNVRDLLLFRFFLIRHTLTHLITTTRFWQKPFKEKMYNRWVLHKELRLLDEINGRLDVVNFRLVRYVMGHATVTIDFCIMSAERI